MTGEATFILGVNLAVAVVLGILIVYRTGRSASAIVPILEQRLQSIEAALGRSDAAIREEFGHGREETREGSRSLREEVTSLFDKLAGSLRASLNDLSTGQRSQLEAFATRLGEAKTEAAADARNLREEIQRTLQQMGDAVGARIGELATAQGEKLDTVISQITTLTEGNERRQETLRANLEAKLGVLGADAGHSAKLLREEITSSLHTLSGALSQTIEQISASQKERLDRVSGSVAELTQRSGEQQEALRKTVEERLEVIRNQNTEKLEQMRLTVDEKLQSTLEQRLGASFQIVADRLNEVYKSMGEMQTLASGVGDLKRLLTNVKTRGAWGEVALGNLLEEMMAPDQYERNVEIVPGSNQRVEYAIRLPGDGEVPVWLPLDAKFPMEDYERLLDASQRGDADAVEIAARGIETVIRSSAKAISEKYIHAPHSTDFAVLFLPTEGLFAEVVRRPGGGCPAARVAHHGRWADDPSFVIGIAPGGLPFARHSKAFERGLEGAGGGEDRVWEIRRHPRQGEPQAAGNAKRHRRGGRAPSPGDGSQTARGRGTAGCRGGRRPRTGRPRRAGRGIRALRSGVDQVHTNFSDARDAMNYVTVRAPSHRGVAARPLPYSFFTGLIVRT
jgi:DNA recombination protein RmuC